VIANAIAVCSAVCYYRIFKQQPPETPFNAQRIFTKKLLGRRTLIFILIVAPPAEETCDIGQGRSENGLYLKAFHLFSFFGSVAGLTDLRLSPDNDGKAR